MYGMPAIRMSACPRTLTKSWRRQACRIFSLRQLRPPRRAGDQPVRRRDLVEDVLAERPRGLLQRPAQPRQRRANPGR